MRRIGQRLITRSLLLAEDAGSGQALITTHSAEVAGTVPLVELHLVRESENGRREVARGRGPGGAQVLRAAREGGAHQTAYTRMTGALAEGPTERGAFPALWLSHRPGDGLDEHRIELVDCESVDKMPSFVRFFKALDIPVAAVADTDQPEKLAKVKAAQPDVLLRWSTHKDWEGVLTGEASTGELAKGLETCRASLGGWDEHADQLRGCLKQRVGDSAHLATATDVPTLIAGYGEPEARSALTCLLRGNSGLDFKSTIYARTICTELTVLPPTATGMIDHIHRFAAGEEDAKGVHDL